MKIKLLFRQSLLEYYQDITGIGFYIHFPDEGKHEVTLYEAAQSDQFALLQRCIRNSWNKATVQ